MNRTSNRDRRNMNLLGYIKQAPAEITPHLSSPQLSSDEDSADEDFYLMDEDSDEDEEEFEDDDDEVSAPRNHRFLS